jgi:hypothetical protein
MSKYLGLLNTVFRTYKKLADKHNDNVADNAESVLVLYYLANGLSIDQVVKHTMYSKALVIFQCNYFAKRDFVTLDYDSEGNIEVVVTELGAKFVTDYIKYLDECIQFNENIYNQICTIEKTIDSMLPETGEANEVIYV